MTLGEMIREKRIELGITQQQLADKVYVTRQTISKWELGKSQPDQISLSLLENSLQFKWHDSSEDKEGRTQIMARIRNGFSLLFGLILFGLLFLPLRIIWITARKNWKNSLLQYIGIPLAICLYSSYMYSLTVKAFYIVLICTVVLYLSLRIYFPLNRTSSK